MTRKVRKFKGVNEDGNDVFEIVELSKAQAVIYDLLVRIAEKINA